MNKYVLTLLFLWISIPGSHGTFDRSEECYVECSKDVKLRVVHLPSVSEEKGLPKKVLIVFQGRESFYEKNEDFYRLLAGQRENMASHKEGYERNVFIDSPMDVWVIDTRGHGGSTGRLGPNDQRDHIDDFETYLRDFQTIINSKIRPHYSSQAPEFYLMGISMGGHLAIRYYQEFEHPFKKVLLVVPMVEFKTGTIPHWFAKPFAYLMSTIGFSQSYVFGKGDIDPDTLTLENEKSHHNREEFNKVIELLKKKPGYVVGGPTYGWLNAAYQSIDQSLAPRQIENLNTKAPFVFFLAGDDHIVNTEASQRLAQEIKAPVHLYPGAWHNLPREIDLYRLPFLRDLFKALHEKS